MRFVVARAEQARVLAERIAGVHRGPHREARDEAPPRDAVEHRELFRHPGRGVVEGEAVAHDADRGVLRAPGEGRSDEVRGRHEPVAVRVVLVHAHPVEATLGRELELVHEVVVHVVGASGVEQTRVDVHPHRRIFLPEVVRQLGIGHQMEPEQLHFASSVVGFANRHVRRERRAPQPARKERSICPRDRRLHGTGLPASRPAGEADHDGRKAPAGRTVAAGRGLFSASGSTGRASLSAGPRRGRRRR